jgi:hypothetical protein
MAMGPTQRQRQRTRKRKESAQYVSASAAATERLLETRIPVHTPTTQNWRGIENGDTEKGNDEEMRSLKYDERKTQQHTQTWSTKQNKANRRDRSRATTGEREREREREREACSFLPSPPCRFASFVQGRKAAVAGPMLPARVLSAAHHPPPNNVPEVPVFFFGEFLFVAKLEIIHRNLEAVEKVAILLRNILPKYGYIRKIKYKSLNHPSIYF